MSEPAVAGESAPAVTQAPLAVASTEQCTRCAAPLARDQRYCLQCGEPRLYLAEQPAGYGSNAAAGDFDGPPPRSSVTSPGAPPASLSSSAAHAPAVNPSAPGLSASVPSAPGPPGPPPASSASSNNSLALIAGVGVLLLAMGVGVLIGRADTPAAKVPPAQVISLGSSGTSSGDSTAGTSTTAPTVAPSSGTAPAKKATKAKEPAGTGASITKPAPPSAASHLRGGSGQSYEQKSKNLPDVVSTG